MIKLGRQGEQGKRDNKVLVAGLMALMNHPYGLPAPMRGRTLVLFVFGRRVEKKIVLY